MQFRANGAPIFFCPHFQRFYDPYRIPLYVSETISKQQFTNFF
jgi:hypothetical protein